MNYNIIDTINIEPILDSFYKLNSDINWTNYPQGNQTGLQYKIGEDPWNSAVGKKRGNEFEHTEINPFFKDTIFESLIKKYNLKRTRLMWVKPKSCYSLHSDTTPRVHIPLITNPQCYFLFNPGGIAHLPSGSVWWVDTRQQHTFLNCSDLPRLHLVGCVDQ